MALIAQPHGIVLVTGPTGSGKTTTLYATLKRLATDAVNVCTVEDPIEMIEPAFNQTQVQPALDLDFAASVRALMRQDPDIIMVGEIRDLETAEMAVQAALTGHLVFSTLHTNDSASAVTRLLDLGDWCAGAAAGAHALSALPPARRGPQPAGPGGCDAGLAGRTAAGALERSGSLPADAGGGLPGLPQYRLPGSQRVVRAADL